MNLLEVGYLINVALGMIELIFWAVTGDDQAIHMATVNFIVASLVKP